MAIFSWYGWMCEVGLRQTKFWFREAVTSEHLNLVYVSFIARKNGIFNHHPLNRVSQLIFSNSKTNNKLDQSFERQHFESIKEIDFGDGALWNTLKIKWRKSMFIEVMSHETELLIKIIRRGMLVMSLSGTYSQ
jgi:hypothetical protein